MKKSIVTIGGGIAGIESSSILANLGYTVFLIEKSTELGGKILHWDHLFPSMRNAGEILEYMKKQSENPGITVFTKTTIRQISPVKAGFYLKSDNSVSFTANAIILASGYEFFDAERKEEYGYKIYDNVITSVDLERTLKEKGTVYTSEGKKPRRIAFIHCVGSRDAKTGNHYCSRICCVTGVKQAIELSKLIPDTQIFCFYMDLRMYDLDFEELYKAAQEKYNIQFIRGRLSEASENADNSIQIKAEDTLSGRPLKMEVDLVVLLVGMEPGVDTKTLGKACHIECNKNGFFNSTDLHLRSNITYQKGVFLAGACAFPMSIRETLDHARSAACEVHQYLENKN